MSDVVSLAQVVAVARAGALSLAPESVGYLALELVEALAAARSRGPGGPTGGPGSGAWSEEHTRLRIDGTFAVAGGKPDATLQAAGAGQAASGVDDESRARRLFAELLERSSGHAPALTAVALHPGGEGIEALRSELEAALIPLNRAAGRRALARLAREVLRNPVRIEGAPAPAVIAPDPDTADTDPLDVPPVHESSAVPSEVAIVGLPDGGLRGGAAAPDRAERPAVNVSKGGDASKGEEASDWQEAVAAAASDEPPSVHETTSEAAAASPEPQSAPDPRPVEQDRPEGAGATEPAMPGPAATREATPAPDVREPAIPEPAPADPASADRVPPDPAPADPASADPAPADPAPADPASAEPAVTEQGGAEPSPIVAPPEPPSEPPPGQAAEAAPSPPSEGSHRERQPTLLGLAPSGRADDLIAELGSARSRDEMRVAADLKRSVGLDPTPRPPPASGSMRPPSPEESAIDEVWDSLPPPPPSAMGSASTRRSSSWESDPVPAPKARASDDAEDAKDIAALSGRGRGRRVLIGVVMVAAIAAAVAWLVAGGNAETPGSNGVPATAASASPSASGSASASGDNHDVAPGSPSASASAGSAQSCAATIVLDGVVPGAEILLRAGAAPIGLPDNALEGDEIVVVADGFAPRRHRVPSLGTGGAPAGATTDAPREISVKLDRAPRATRGAPWEPWPPARDVRPSAKRRDEPHRDSRESAGARYRVVSRAPNAEVWLSLGRGSGISVGGLACGAPVDLLVAGEHRHAPPRRLTVPGSVLAAPPGGGPAVAHFSVAP